MTVTVGADTAFGCKRMHGGTYCNPSLHGLSTTNHKMANPWVSCYTKSSLMRCIFLYAFQARSFAFCQMSTKSQDISCLQAKRHNFRDF